MYELREMRKFDVICRQAHSIFHQWTDALSFVGSFISRTWFELNWIELNGTEDTDSRHILGSDVHYVNRKAQNIDEQLSDEQYKVNERVFKSR